MKRQKLEPENGPNKDTQVIPIEKVDRRVQANLC